jgi:hypothetical protein
VHTDALSIASQRCVPVQPSSVSSGYGIVFYRTTCTDNTDGATIIQPTDGLGFASGATVSRVERNMAMKWTTYLVCESVCLSEL